MVASSHPGRIASPAGFAPAHFLIVTNSPNQGQILKETLADLGVTARLAIVEGSGPHALGAGPFDAVVLDVDLGYPAIGDLVRRVRQDHPLSALAMLVGWWDQRAEDVQDQCDALIYKPAHPQQLLEALRRTGFPAGGDLS